MSAYTSTSSTSLISLSQKQKYIKTSIGGAGNFLPSSLSPSTSPSSSRRPSSTTSTTGVFHTGIGGFGNRASVSEQGGLVKGTEVRVERESWHVGIGGAGNRRRSSVVSGGEESVRSGADAMRERVWGYFVR